MPNQCEAEVRDLSRPGVVFRPCRNAASTAISGVRLCHLHAGQVYSGLPVMVREREVLSMRRPVGAKAEDHDDK